eukprot:TRINITY_DN3390_c0_g1_i3.p1 TRINITY_DN3390_c0_g1~~TRINITY_DN3390_c0_g1_i3.p1  ORF type:complete len:167 (+),score=40.44 TRINITY_DN3390_c0_g1_i3:109-609(+)
MAYSQLLVALGFVFIRHATALAGVRESVKAALDQAQGSQKSSSLSVRVLQKDASRVLTKDSSGADGSAHKGGSAHVLQKDSSGADGSTRKGGLLQQIMGGRTGMADTEGGASAKKSSLLQRVMSMGARPAATSGLDRVLVEDSATEGLALVQTKSKLVLKRRKEEL